MRLPSINKMNTHVAGQKGEDWVCSKLKSQGIMILDRNVRMRFAEIDIVAFEPSTETIIFIEVRTRQTARLGHPAETINARKKDHIRKAASVYLSKKQIHNSPVRFDVATIIWDTNQYDYFENAF